jgi:hypothetical protein
VGEAGQLEADRPIAVTPGGRASSAVINFLSRDLGRAIYLQQKHLKADDGSCLGCNTQMAPTIWPCVILVLADECMARQIPMQRKGER